MIVDTLDPGSRRHGTATPPDFTTVVGHLPTALWQTSSWLGTGCSLGESLLPSPVIRLIMTGGGSWMTVTVELSYSSSGPVLGVSDHLVLSDSNTLCDLVFHR